MRKKEIQTYLLVWAVVFAMEPLIWFFQFVSGHGSDFGWDGIVSIWGQILPLFVLFALHDMAATYFIRRKQIAPYVIITLILISLYSYYTVKTGRGPEAGGPPSLFPDDMAPRPPEEMGRRIHPESMKIMLGILLIGVNLGVKSFLRGIEGERKLHKLEAQSLKIQLEALRYQINPHFFMNTLNNIHALVDIDPEKAKESIEEFSRLMRFVLYDGHEPTIPLAHELEFMDHYVSLMKMRYPDDIEIKIDVPKVVSAQAQVPPLVMISYVENAFKHGISYEKHSFIRVSVKNDDGKITFRCTNSRNNIQQTEQHGMGLDNVKARLDLLYGENYTLNIQEDTETYDILLILPEKKND